MSTDDDDTTTTAKKVVHDLKHICHDLQKYDDVTDEQKAQLHTLEHAHDLTSEDFDYIAAIVRRVLEDR